MTVYAWISYFLSNVFTVIILTVVLPLFALWLVSGFIFSIRGWFTSIN